MRRALLLSAAAVGALATVAVVAVARSGDNAETTYAGTTRGATLAALTAALALCAAAAFARVPRNGYLALLAEACWLAPIVVGWVAGPPLLRASALIAASFAFPVLAHLALASRTGRLQGRLERAIVAVAYAWAGLVSLLLALVRDPFYDPSCWSDCDGNAFLLVSSPSLAQAFVEARPWVELALGAAVVAVSVPRLRSRRRARLAGTAAAAVGAVAVAHGLASLSAPFEQPLDAVFRAIFFAASVAVVLVAVAVTAPAAEIALRRRAVIRVVASLDDAPAPAELERRLGAALGDSSLRIAFWLPELAGWADADGCELIPSAAAHRRVVTSLVHGGEPLATIDHDEASLAAIAPALTPAIHLSVDNARLRAGLLAQVRVLQGARRQVVSDGDDERRRLERDLHDGVQQQLLAIGAELRAAARLARASADTTADALDGAQAAMASVLEEVRSVAHGIYPAILTDAGLAAAVASLADVAPLPVRVVRVPDGRFPTQVEAAAYQVVVESVANAVAYADATAVAIDAVEEDEALVVEVCDDGGGGAAIKPVGGLAELADRVGAIDGTLAVTSAPGAGTSIRAVIPCAS